jgi:preprotein translocase subunit YajC
LIASCGKTWKFLPLHVPLTFTLCFKETLMFRSDAVTGFAKMPGTSLFLILSGFAGLTVLAPSLAQAQTAAPGGPPFIMQFVPFIVLFGVMYFLIMRPQQKKQKDHLDFVSQLKRGDEVVTASGIFGRIEGLNGQFVTLEISPDVRIKILRSQVATSIAAATMTNEVKA